MKILATCLTGLALGLAPLAAADAAAPAPDEVALTIVVASGGG